MKTRTMLGRFCSCVLLMAAIVGASAAASGTGWPQPPAGLGRDGLGLTGIWESFTWVDGKMLRLFWIVRHSVAKGQVAFRRCDTAKVKKTGNAEMDNLAYWSRVKGNRVELSGRHLSWGNTGGHANPSIIQLRWVHWLELRGQFAPVTWSEHERTGSYYWKPGKKSTTVWRRMVPQVDMSTFKIVKRGNEADQAELVIAGRNLPKFTYTSHDYPYFIQFDDSKLKMWGSPTASTRTKMHIKIRIERGAPLGPRGAYILGRYFPRLFTLYPPRPEGVLEFVDEGGRDTPVVGRHARVALRLTLNPKHPCALKNALTASVKSTRGGKPVALELSRVGRGVFRSGRIGPASPTPGQGPLGLDWRPGDRLISTFTDPTLNKPLHARLQLALQELYFADKNGTRLPVLPWGDQVFLVARFDSASVPAVRSLRMAVSGIPGDAEPIDLLRDKKMPTEFRSANPFRIVYDPDNVTGAKPGIVLIEGRRGAAVEARYDGPVGGNRHLPWLAELSARAGVAIGDDRCLLEFVDKAGRPFELGPMGTVQYVPMDTDVYLRLRAGKNAGLRAKVLEARLTRARAGQPTLKRRLDRKADGTYGPSAPIRVAPDWLPKTVKEAVRAGSNTEFVASCPGAGGKNVTASAVFVNTRASVIRFRAPTGSVLKALPTDGKYFVEVTMCGLLPRHARNIRVALAAQSRKWEPKMVRLYHSGETASAAFVSDLLEEGQPLEFAAGDKLTATYRGRLGDASYTTVSRPLSVTAAK